MFSLFTMQLHLEALLMYLLTGGITCDILNVMQVQRIKAMAEHVMQCEQIPGMSLLIVRRLETVHIPLGVETLASKVLVSQNTKFGIASLTKAFTATLLVMLLKESKQNYTLDTPLRDILGSDHLFGDEQRSKFATVKDILSHRVGVARGDLAVFGGYSKDWNLGRLAGLLQCLPSVVPFRDRYVYSNFMYSLAGHVIEHLTNQSFSEVLKSRLLRPLGMESTETQLNESDRELATPYLSVKGRMEPANNSLFSQTIFLPALGMVSTTGDMAKWINFQLTNGLDPEGRRVVDPSVIQATHQPVVPHIDNKLRPRYPRPDLTFGYGLGWNQAVYQGLRRMWHSGSLFGYYSMIWLYPDIDLAIYVSINGLANTLNSKDRLSALLYYVTDAVLGEPPWLDRLGICSFPYPTSRLQLLAKMQQTREQKSDYLASEVNLPPHRLLRKLNSSAGVDSASIILDKFVGVYKNPLFGNATITLEEIPVQYSRQVFSDQSGSQMQLKVVIGERFTGTLNHIPPEVQTFEMEPSGIYSFSSHPFKNQPVSTLSIEFNDFDKSDVPYTFKAIWQPEEIISFWRDTSTTHCEGQTINMSNRVKPLGIHNDGFFLYLASVIMLWVISIQ